jgi:hypothetical protein
MVLYKKDHMSNVKETIKKIIPFTSRGIFFFLLSSTIFIIGIVRADLAALFWGCGFCLLTMYSLIGNYIFKSFAGNYIRTHIHSETFTLSSTGIFPKTETWAEVKAVIPSFFLPGFTVKATIILRWYTRTPIELSLILAPGLNKEIIRFTPAHRGTYKSSFYDFHFQDLLGFTSSCFSLPVEEYIKVYPAIIKREELMMKISGEESTDTQKTKRTSDELLEVKKYYPGDDVRRLNWKVFAHTGELFVRKGEETPPPDSHLLFILDPTQSPLLDYLPAPDYLDELIEVISSIMIMYCENGNPINLSIPGRKHVETFSPKQGKDILSLLADIWWMDEERSITLPPKKHMHALVFSSPGSLSLPHILRTLKARSWNISLYFKDYTFIHREKTGISLKQYLFIYEDTIQRYSANRSDSIAFKQALFAEIDRYKKPPWRLKYVREI